MDRFLSLPSSPLSLLFADLVSSLLVYLNIRKCLLNWKHISILFNGSVSPG